MYGNGAQIGMAAIARRARQTLRDLQEAAIACSVVVVVTATLSAVAFRIAATTIRRAGTTTAAASALFASHSLRRPFADGEQVKWNKTCE